MELIYVILIIIGIILLLIIGLYNSLIQTRNQVKNSFAQIDVQLKRRFDLIPNLVNTVKGYAKHEKSVFEEVTKARTSAMKASNVKDKSKANNKLSNTLKSLFAVSENYPKLKANENFLKLQEEIIETENQISAVRRIYNQNVTYFNTKIQTFPNNIFANIFKFTKEEFFTAKSLKKKNVKVEL